ncbi:MAG: hypothetical protein RLY70_2414 [Planctomycetota bacterium]|jgi:hypothetical protein
MAGASGRRALTDGAIVSRHAWSLDTEKMPICDSLLSVTCL